MSDLRSQAAFRSMTAVPAPRPGVTVRLIQPGMVSVLAHKDKTQALIAKAKVSFGLELSDAPAHRSNGTVAALGLGPGRWMFLDVAPAVLADAFADLASLSEHGDGYAVFDIGGPQARRALAKGVPLNLEMFGEGDAAVTTIAHVGAIVWKSGPERFAIAVFRSYAASFWHWLHASAAEFGLEVESDA